MSQNINTTGENDKKRKKKGLMLFLLLLLVFVIVTGVLAAFFSDFIFRQATIDSATLDISGTYAFKLNDVDATDTITNFKPGDSMIVSVSVTNQGTASAWIRDKISFSQDNPEFLNNLTIYEGAYTREQLETGGLEANIIDLDEGSGFGGIKVIDGSGETESGGDHDYVGENYQTAYTIYFLPTAGNEAQSKSVTVNVETQALQYRNNNTTLPGDAAWATVSAS